MIVVALSTAEQRHRPCQHVSSGGRPDAGARGYICVSCCAIAPAPYFCDHAFPDWLEHAIVMGRVEKTFDSYPQVGQVPLLVLEMRVHECQTRSVW